MHYTAETLNKAFEFDVPVEVKGNGSAAPRLDIFAPDLLDEQVSSGWELLNGFSGQDRYAGPIMHPSEYIGGGLARHILQHPGVYVAVAAYYSPEAEGDETTIEGWAIAKQTTETAK